MKKKMILAIGVIALFIGMAFIPVEASLSTNISEKNPEISVLTEPIKFDSVKIELHGKCKGWNLCESYSRCILISAPFTDHVWILSYCFELGIKIPGQRYELTEGWFDISTPDGETLIVEYDGDTHIDYVSRIVRESCHEIDYVKGILYQGVEIYV